MATISDLYTHLNTLTKKWFYTKSEIKNIALTGKATDLTDSTAHSNIGSAANSTQANINTKIDTELGKKANSADLSTVATTGKYTDLTNIPSTFTPSAHTHTASDVKDATAHSNIGSSANDTQATVNTKIDTALGTKANTFSLKTVATTGKYSDLTGIPSTFTPSTHTHTSSEITDSTAYSRLGTSAGATQATINNAINTKIGALLDVDLITVVASLGTASASTMNKLYLVAESTSKTNDSYEIYVTVRTGSSGNYTYAWEKVDTARIDLSGYSTTDHTHGNITKDGKVGTTANKPLITTTGGAVTTGSFGSSTSTSATEFVACNDSRLSDTRTPKAHNQAATTISNDQAYNNIKAGESTTLTLTTQKLINDAINTKLGSKVDTATGKGLSSNDFTDTYKGYVDNLVSSTATTKNAHVHGNITSDGKVGTATGKPLITTTGGAVTTGSFGSSTSTSATEFVACSDSRLSDARTPTSHTHGNVTNDGKVGTTAGKPLITGTNGAITAGSFGSSTSTSATEFVACNDSRLTNSRTPTSHTHGNLQNTGQIGSTAVANGIAVTDSSGKITVTKGSTANTTSAPQLYYYNGVLTIGG